MSTQFGILLKEFRIRQALSQRSLANLAGINTSYISRLESGEREVTSRDLALRLAEILALSKDQIDEWLLSAGYASDRLKNIPFGELAKLMEEFEESSFDSSKES